MKRHLLFCVLFMISGIVYCNIGERECFAAEERAQESTLEQKMELEKVAKREENERNERLASKSRYLTNKGSYMEIKVEAQDGDNITAQLQAAFILARTKATEEIPYKIILPKGVYSLSSTLHIYSNTQLILKDAVLVRKFQEGPMIMSGNQKEVYSGERERNIVIEGGVFDGNCFDELYGAVTTSFSNLSFSYAENIRLKDVTVLNNMGGHHVEFYGVDKIWIENCILKHYCENKTVEDTYGKEALRFGLAKEGEKGEEKMVPCSRIVVQNNKFQDVYRGIGFQYIAEKKYYNQILVKKNQFFDCEQEAIILSSLRNSKIAQNTIQDARVGILIESVNPLKEKKLFDCRMEENEIKKGKELEISPMISNLYRLRGDF